ncbi:bactofilin family protein [Marinibactrum halimedae]|uniref:Polymer-forming cytoskeletal protein n=1 Tax=Marinibactrum halimedae TaxID=1444977 RepID=A0AA37T3G4_9GAMM|nr:polymer-forming cytoskeletal protein [Marinibactrum halimedae]MCD9460492.1 polymer-forming cytoskeletal protein [Marinibactrum halimedae]GLS25898.1 hypothetical protein GCM10007877_16120 [Marinibactrum halimedae]
MFGKKNSEGAVSKSGTTLISKNTEVLGDVVFTGNLMVEGVVRGNINVRDGKEAHLQLLDTAEVTGEINVPTIVINGRVRGDVYSSKHIELAAKAVVDGNVHYNLIEMVRGSQVNGNLVYEPNAQNAPSSKGDANNKGGISASEKSSPQPESHSSNSNVVASTKVAKA